MDLQALLQHPNLWRAGQINTLQAASQQSVKTGYTQLDEQLPGNGWPAAGLMEFLLSSAGIGELRLLAPALRTLSQGENRWVAWINPPFIPYAPALEAIGIDINKILLIHPRNHQDTLWALERACKSGSCSSVLAWLDEKKLKLKDTQRLQVAAKQGRTLTCLFRPQTAAAQASMAQLRLALRTAKPGEVTLDILKRRGSWPLHNLTLPVAEVTGTQHQTPSDITQQLELWRAVKSATSTEKLTHDTPTLPPEAGLQQVHTHTAVQVH